MHEPVPCNGEIIRDDQGMNFSYSIPLLAFAALGFAGCLPDGPGEKGELGNDRFFYECALPEDAACDDEFNSGLLDIPSVALGSTFAIDTENYDTDAFSPTDRLREVQVSSGAVAFEALQEGQAVIMSGVTGEPGEASDLTHIVVVAPSAVGFFRRGTEFVRDPDQPGLMTKEEWVRVTTDVDAQVGEVIELRVAPLDGGGGVLAGALPITWSGEPDEAFMIFDDASDNVIEVRADVAGATSITVTVGELSGTLGFDVQEVAQ